MNERGLQNCLCKNDALITRLRAFGLEGNSYLTILLEGIDMATCGWNPIYDAWITKPHVFLPYRLTMFDHNVS